MTGEEIVALSKKHTIFEWVAQASVDPIPVARAKGIYFWTPEGKRFIDFNSQLMCVNIGHSDPRVIEAIQKQAAELTYVTSSLTTEPRARLGAKLAEIAPGDIDVFFFTNGGAEANEHAIKIARAFTGRQKIVSFYRSYHGATAGAMAATGEPRNWLQAPLPGFVHVLSPYHGLARGTDTADEALRDLDEVIQLEGPQSSRRHHHGAGDRNQRHSDSSRRLPPGSAHSVRQVRNPVDCRRSHDWLRTHGRMVRGRSLERRARHHHDGKRNHERLRAAWRGWHAAEKLPRSSRTHRFRADSPTAAIRWRARRRSRRLPCTRRTT